MFSKAAFVCNQLDAPARVHPKQMPTLRAGAVILIQFAGKQDVPARRAADTQLIRDCRILLRGIFSSVGLQVILRTPEHHFRKHRCSSFLFYQNRTGDDPFLVAIKSV